MKRIILFGSVLILSFSSVFAQSEMDAFKLSQNDTRGTARSVSMGGAFGALGGDVSAISINPAGIGVYKSSEIVTTLNFQNTNIDTELNTGKINDSKFKFNFDNLAFVSAFSTNSDIVPYVNFGFSYNRLKNFDRKYSTKGDNLDYSLANYMSLRTTASEVSNPDEFLFKNNLDIEPLRNHDWLSVFGYNAGLINYAPTPTNQYRYLPSGAIPQNGIFNELFVEEKGAIDTYDFNMGTTFSDIISAGITVSLTDISHHKYSYYSEAYAGYGNDNGFFLKNWSKTEGSGVQLGAGVIVKPIKELRIGAAYHSPTWYNMTTFYSANFNATLKAMEGGYNWSIDTEDFRNDFKLRTPDRFTFSLAGVIGQSAIISADYEYTNYGNNMKLFNDMGGELSHNPNGAIKDHFKGASTLRLGAEIRFTPRFSGRVGYAWTESPLKNDFKNGKEEVWTVGSESDYTLDGDINYFTYGMGYRFSRNFYSDIAFVYKTQKSDLYFFDQSAKSTMKSNTFQGLLTLGYKF